MDVKDSKSTHSDTKHSTTTSGVKQPTTSEIKQSDKLKSLSRKWNAAAQDVRNILEEGRAAKTDPDRKDRFNGLYKVLEKYYSRFEALTDELYDHFDSVETPMEFPNEKQKGLINSVKSYYLECHELHSKLNVEANPIHNITVMGERPQAGYSLPKIQVPKFDGEYINWPKFRDTYASMVHNHEGLTDTQKFHYLVNSLTGNAKSLIGNLPIEDANYSIAWNALNSAYENKRVLASVYLNKLLSFKPHTGKPSVDSYRSFLSQIAETIDAFKLLKITNESDFILFHLAVRGLDQNTREQFEFKLGKDEFPTTTRLTEFVRERQLAFQLADSNASGGQSTFWNSSSRNSFGHKTHSKNNEHSKTSLIANPSQKPTIKKSNNSDSSFSVQHKAPLCIICHNEEYHTLSNCPKFYTISVKQRVDALQNWIGCKNCLSERHPTTQCPSKYPCRFCKGHHNSLLCLKHLQTPFDSKKIDAPKPGAASSNSSSNVNLMGTSLNSDSPENVETQVILGTAWADFLDVRGQYQKLRLVVDSASQYSYLTQRGLHRLGLNLIKSPRKISCLGGTMFDGAKGVVSCQFRSRMDPSIALTTEAVVVKNITSFLPTIPVPQPIFKKLITFELADPKFFQPSSVDFLLGADLFPDVITGSVKSVGENMPKLFSSIFGYIVIGKYAETRSCEQHSATSLFALSHINENLNFDLENFWKLEEVNDAKISHSPDYVQAEEFFVNHHYRLSDGRFGVKLPFKGPVPDLSHSDTIAKKRFQNLEIKFRRHPDLKRQYTEFMSEYISLGHMEPTNNESKYVIPHHGITKEDRNKIKLRVVFDASCKTQYGSLNDFLLVGEPLQNDIKDILLNFRAHRIVFATDAVKMYRQIELSPEDRPYQHVYWRSDPHEALQKYELKTVTYGMSCSPHLALRCLKSLQIEHADEFPLASKVLSRDIYVDDVVTGADSIPEALELQRQIIGILARGCFELSKWASNSHQILDAVQPAHQDNSSFELHSTEHPDLKVLGLQWDPSSDTFSYKTRVPDQVIFTKRAILSTVASIFDPLGFVSPAVLLLKVLIQELWLAKVGWDEKIPDRLARFWSELIAKIPYLSEIKIDRFVCVEKPYQYQVIGFSDASETGYCATLYLRAIQGSKITIKLLTAKTKVAPTKRETIPRLELCGAWLLARLYNSLHPFFDVLSSPSLSPVFFTDSAIVLAWINTPSHKLKVYVSNRISKIQELTPVTSWRHIDGNMNPSDCGSRGLAPEQLINHELWWNGPPWLLLPMDSWPKSKVEYPAELPETKKEKESPTVLFSCSALPHLIDWISRFSSYHKLIRVTALILRVIHNRKFKDDKRIGTYLLAETIQAFNTCVKLVQLYGFFQGNVDNISKVQITYKSLTPFLDANGILRVGGRIENADINPNQKHQVLLPYNSHFSTLLVDFFHSTYAHPGPNLLQALIQTRFWIPSLRRLVRQRIRKCLKCFKLRAKSIIPAMGNLPDYRVKPGRCFLHCGIDFAGPFSMKESNRRKAPTSKVYLCLFVCMSTKAVHLEAVTSLSTEAFLACFSRFISRRGLPSAVYTDCGSNFLGASKELQLLGKWYNQENTQRNITDFATQHNVQWFFNPPYSPHFGGLWEAGVKSVKRHLTLVAGELPMTFEELSTVFNKIEAVLNSRPLCPLSDDPSESDYLSPGHFLIGAPLLTNPEPTLLDTKMNLLSRWQLIKRVTEDIWARWRLEYLSTLQKRSKWHQNPSRGLKEGDLVLLKTKEAPPLRWPTARVLKTHPGPDGQVRVVTLRTPSSTYIRSTANLIPLVPLQNEYEDNE